MELKYGRDYELEEQANQLLAEGVGENKRSVERDAEKIAYEAGRLSIEDLRYYDPLNDWDTLDEPSMWPIDASSIAEYAESICAEVDDVNIRAKNDQLSNRRGLMRNIKDDEDWGSTREEIPLLGGNDGPRKACTRCKQLKGPKYFYAQPRNSDGLSSWCKLCQRGINKSQGD